MRTNGLVAGSIAAAVTLAGVVLAQQPTFKSGVDVVLVDVTVVDRAGLPVDNLKPEDFQVSVDRKPRKIVSVQLLRYQVSDRPIPGKPAVTALTARPAAATTAPPPPRNVLIVIDEDSLEPGEGMNARNAAEKFLDRLAPDDRIGVVTIPRPRSTAVLTTRRSDVRKMLSAIITGVSSDVGVSRYSIGLSEAFAVERGDLDAKAKIYARECLHDPGWQGATVQNPGKGNLDQVCASEIWDFVRQMYLQAHLRGQRSIDALRGLGEGLSHLDGPKTLVLVSGGAPTPDLHSPAALDNLQAAFAAGQITLYTIYMQPEQFGQVKNRLSPTPSEDMSLERQGVENITGVAGGTLMDAIGTLDQYFDRVAVEMSGVYLLGVEVSPEDRNGQPHFVRVSVNRPGVDVRAREQYVIPREKPATPAVAPAAAKASKPAAPPAAPRALVMWIMTPEVDAALARAGEYATTYES